MGEWWRVGVLLGIFAVLFGAWWWVKRLKPLQQSNPSGFKILDVKYPAHQVVVMLVEAEGQKFLLAKTQGNLSWQKLEGTSVN